MKSHAQPAISQEIPSDTPEGRKRYIYKKLTVATMYPNSKSKEVNTCVI